MCRYNTLPSPPHNLTGFHFQSLFSSFRAHHQKLFLLFCLWWKTFREQIHDTLWRVLLLRTRFPLSHSRCSCFLASWLEFGWFTELIIVQRIVFDTVIPCRDITVLLFSDSLFQKFSIKNISWSSTLLDGIERIVTHMGEDLRLLKVSLAQRRLGSGVSSTASVVAVVTDAKFSLDTWSQLNLLEQTSDVLRFLFRFWS